MAVQGIAAQGIAAQGTAIGGIAARSIAAALSATLLLAGCSSVDSVRKMVVGTPSPYLSGYIGNVVADEPVAALAGRDVLARGGNAADAAAAVGLALAVTLPSRASLGGGGACVAMKAGASAPEAFLFTPQPGTGVGAGSAGARPASVPTMLRGLYLLQATQGSVSFDDLVKPAARLARSGITVSRALADDLAAVSGPLLADPSAAAIFAPGGKPVGAGDQLLQPDLAGSLDRIAMAGPADLYTGLLWQYYTADANQAGGGLTGDDIRQALPGLARPVVVQAGRDSVAFAPPPADGGLGAAAAFRALQSGSGDAASVSQGTVAAWRAAHPDAGNRGNFTQEAQAIADAGGSSGRLGRLPASTSFTIVDRNGGAVACALTMDNLFGTGRIAGRTGIVLGASPKRFPPPLLTPVIAWTGTGRFRAAVASSGQNEAAEAAAEAMTHILNGQPPAPVTENGRVNAISCPSDVSAAGCTATADPRGMGLATRSDR